MKALLAILIVSAALAGCADSATDAPPETVDFSGIEAKSTATTGVIRGVVVDAAIVPVADVTVTLQGAGDSTTTNENGVFAFSELEPATYFLSASKPGWTTVQQATVVVAGVAEPDAVRIQLEQDPGSTPYYSENYWQGFFTCSSAALQVCPAVNLVFELAGQDEPLEDEFLTTVPIDMPPQWINTELVWESTQATGSTLDFYLEKVSKSDGTDWSFQRSTVGESPILITVDADEAAGYSFGTANDMRHRVFPGGVTEDLPGALVGAQINQEFEIFSHVFYNYQPPEGWRFTEDSTPPAP